MKYSIDEVLEAIFNTIYRNKSEGTIKKIDCTMTGHYLDLHVEFDSLPINKEQFKGKIQ